MADLDDFFAKKDRKKSKGKKFATTEEVAKKLEDTSSKKPDKVVKKERAQEGEEGGAPVHEQDEWKEFEEEKKDYSGLKIGNLTINSPEGAVGNTENFSEQHQGDEAGSDVDKKVGPWKRVDAEVAEREVEKKTEAPVPAAPPAAPTSNTYVPPSLRNQQQQPQPLQPSRLRSKAAPDIHNEEYFPSLASSKADQRKNRSEGSFEVVSHNKSSSHRHVDQSKLTTNQGPKLNLGNRFNTLSNDS